MRKKAFALALAALMLCGCGAKNEKSGKKEELPADRPYNRFIMETDKGFYTNHLGGYGERLALRFCERDTGNQIFLCAKPECTHNGSDKCTATYKELSCLHSTLYDGAIYSFLMEKGDNITLSIYKSALDGTSITKVGDVFSVANSTDEESIENCLGVFAIHKGYAYIPYRVVLGGSPLFGFTGSGLVKMDISTGKTEELWRGEDYFSSYPQDIYGDGDFVYYTIASDKEGRGFYRYDIKSGELKRLWEKKAPVAGDNKFFFMEYDEDKAKYAVFSCGKTDEDIEKANADGFELMIEDIGSHVYGTTLAYEDKLIIEDEGKVKIYSENGELLGEKAFLTEEEKGDKYEFTYPYFQIDISDGKVYFFDWSMEHDRELYVVDYEDGSFTSDYYSITYSCPIEDIIAGTGEWKFEYGEKDIFSSGLMKEEPIEAGTE